MNIRPATRADLSAMTAIYNHYIRTSPATFDTATFDVDQRESWFDQFGPTGRYRCLVADYGRVLGYATSSRFNDRPAYHTSVATSVYCAPDARGRGLGRSLYTALLSALECEGVHRALAGITLPNAPSERLHVRMGFRRVGLFREVGHKHGRFWDVAWYERDV